MLHMYMYMYIYIYVYIYTYMAKHGFRAFGRLSFGCWARKLCT